MIFQQGSYKVQKFALRSGSVVVYSAYLCAWGQEFDPCSYNSRDKIVMLKIGQYSKTVTVLFTCIFAQAYRDEISFSQSQLYEKYKNLRNK